MKPKNSPFAEKRSPEDNCQNKNYNNFELAYLWRFQLGRIRAQRIGRGSPSFRASIRRKFRLKFPSQHVASLGLVKGIVRALAHDPARGSPVAEVELPDGNRFAVAAVQGISEGQTILIGREAPIGTANIIQIGTAPEGTVLSSIELIPGDGGKLARASGSYATVMGQVGEKTLVRLPSKRLMELPSQSLGVVGVVGGSGRPDIPFLKAGAKYHWMKAKRRPYPRVRGVAMVSALHPFGGGSHKKPGKSTTVSRFAPPGRKVGLIAARRTGRRKR